LKELCYVFSFLFGLVLGSFYNVLVYRLPRGMSVVSPSSRCPSCGEPIRWYDNVPLLSYLLLKGKCRSCGAPISLRYPLVELSSALLALYACHAYGLTLEALLHYAFFSLLLVVGLVDWYHFIIPPQLSVGGTLFFLAVSPFREEITFEESFLGALLGFGLPFLIYLYYAKVRKVEGIGLGDALLLALVGAFAGPYGVFVSLLLGSLLGLLYVIPTAVKHKSLQFAVPFGPFLALGAFLGVVFKEEITAYLFGVSY